VLLGATRGMGRAVARELAARGDALFLLGRDAAELARSAADLEARGASGRVGHAPCDLLDPRSFEPALAAAHDGLGPFDTVVVSAGLFATQEVLESDAARLTTVLDANFSGTILFCEAVRRRLVAAGGGTLCVFGSVAGDRARKKVVLYGATKAGLAAYLDGLDLAWRQAGLRVVTVKPGFVRTSMTAGLDAPPFASDPEPVARQVVRAIDAGRRVVYAPPVWRIVMAVVRRLPRPVMRRASF
jgi:short-subunit dehydrogenase